jgi:acyl dehydratase
MIALGDQLPQLVRTISLTDMVAYAGATWDWHRLHYDEDFVHDRHLPAPVVDGQVFGALFVKALQDWLGPMCFVQELSFQYRNLMFAGEELTISGTVSAVDGARVSIDLSAVISASQYGDARPAVSPASALVATDRVDGPPAGPGPSETVS